MHAITDRDIIATLSNVCYEKQIEQRFLIKYTTVKQWGDINIQHPKEGYKRFLVEFFRRVNEVELSAVQKNLDGFEAPDEIFLAKVLKMPIRDIRNYITSKIPWKHETINFLKSIDARILQHQKEMIDFLILKQEYGPSGNREPEDIKLVFTPKNKKTVFQLSTSQKDMGCYASPTKEQLSLVEVLAIQKGLKVPPKTKLYAPRLEKWAAKIALRPDATQEEGKKRGRKSDSEKVKSGKKDSA
jgi:hypothetical protein